MEKFDTLGSDYYRCKVRPEELPRVEYVQGSDVPVKLSLELQAPVSLERAVLNPKLATILALDMTMDAAASLYRQIQSLAKILNYTLPTESATQAEFPQGVGEPRTSSEMER